MTHQHTDDGPHGPRLALHLAGDHPEVEMNRIVDDLELERVHREAHEPHPDLWLARCDVCPWQGDYPTAKADAQRELARHVMREHSPDRASR